MLSLSEHHAKIKWITIQHTLDVFASPLNHVGVTLQHPCVTKVAEHEIGLELQTLASLYIFLA